MNNSHSNIQKISMIAFSLIAVVIIICSVLIGYNLKQQGDMLRASGISYDQRILLERINEDVHILLDSNSNAGLAESVILQTKKDILINAKILNDNQAELKKLLLNQSEIFFKFGKPFEIIARNKNLHEIEVLLERFNERVDKISAADVSTLLAGKKYWGSVGTLQQPYNGLLFSRTAFLNTLVFLNRLVYKSSLRQNEKIRILYAIMFVSALTGLWLIWFLTLRPLSKHLAGTYREIISKNNDLKFQASHDSMTQLLNRSAFNKKMAELSQGSLGIGKGCLILIDADEFKSINDNLGHQAGDEVLMNIAKVMQQDPLVSEFAYRLGGDEFAIIIDEIDNHQQLIDRLDCLVKNIRQPIIVAGNEIITTCSLGVAWGDKCGKTLTEVFNAADAALYKVKEDGRNNYQLFGDMSDQNVTQALKDEQELQRAVKEKQFIVHYQPVVHLETGELDSLEALARWQHPTRGELLPEAWLPLADRLSLSSEITLQIMDLVEKDYHHWKARKLEIRTVSFNLTEQMLVSGKAYSHLKGILERTSDTPNWLGIEVTESIVFDRSFEQIQRQLQLIHEAGIKIALDDFGTGFANLSHLRRIPFDSLKIDESFTSEILNDPGMHLIVKSLIDLSIGLEKQIICEGIETAEVREVLLEMGCKFSQGFLHNKGLPFEKSCTLLSLVGKAA